MFRGIRPISLTGIDKQFEGLKTHEKTRPGGRVKQTDQLGEDGLLGCSNKHHTRAYAGQKCTDHPAAAINFGATAPWWCSIHRRRIEGTRNRNKYIRLIQ